MNKKIVISLLLIVVVIYIYAGHFNNKDQIGNKQMWVSSEIKHMLRTSTTTDIDRINRVLKILDNLEWHEGVLDYDNDADYEFWISCEPHEERTSNCDLWIKNNDVVILDIRTRKYVMGSNSDVRELISILEVTVAEYPGL